VNSVWNRFTSIPLSIDTQSSFGTIQGKVVGGIFTFKDASGKVVGSFSKPSTHDILTCSTGPFQTNTAGMAALTPRLSAPLNRSTLLTQTFEPSNVATYYKENITNHYSRICHETNIDKRGYAFPYDDVAPNGGVDQSGSVFDGNPALLTIIVGGGSSGVDATSHIKAAQFNSNNGVLTEPTSDVDGGNDAGWISNGDWIGFDNVDFHADGMSAFTVRIASGAAAGVSGTVQLVLDSVGSAPVASFSVQNTGGWQTWKTVTVNMSRSVAGTHKVFLKFVSGQPADFVNVNWFTFQKAAARVNGVVAQAALGS